VKAIKEQAERVTEYAEIPSIAQEMLKTEHLLVHNLRPVDDADAIEIISRMWEGKLSSS